MRVGIGISGGVDSVVAALLLREAGHDVVGVTMTLGRADEAASLAAASAAAGRLGIPLKVFDFAGTWRTRVLDYVRDTYRAGQTPNPCVRCNETVKFALLPQAAFDLGCDRFATGHYARLRDGRLFRAADRAKDQSYFLYRVQPAILARTLFPLGELTKEDVRERARAAGFAVAEKPDSQDFCGGDARALAARPDRPGTIEDARGNLLGRHNGFWRYTVGQRKGLGIGGAGEPYYVLRLDAAENRVVVGRRSEAARTTFAVTDARWLVPPPEGSVACRVKVRSAGEPRGPAAVTATPEGGARITAPEGVFGVAPGQSAVFYGADSDLVLGGGVIADDVSR